MISKIPDPRDVHLSNIPSILSRRAGVLLHPTSLPGIADCGDLGPEAFRFVDFLTSAGMSVWQMLPTGPTHSGRSPYQSLSVHAGNPALISLEKLQERGWLKGIPSAAVQDMFGPERQSCLIDARIGFEAHASREDRDLYRNFIDREADWLQDFALYSAIRADRSMQPWSQWPAPIRDRQPETLQTLTRELADLLQQVFFEQFVWFQQWLELRHYANQRGVLLFGDMPIFVANDSADVWANREYFALDSTGNPETVAGVPPDYFSATGQCWGNPHYRWERMQADGYSWWVERMRTQLELVDLVRMDHFRGFESYWEIPVDAPTAETGRWVKAPGEALFERLEEVFGNLPLVAEDLGTITPAVDSLRGQFGLPGMKILQFAFDGGADNPYLPHRHVPHSVVYTGTHDNDTSKGWFESLSPAQQGYVLDYLGSSKEPMPWPLIRCALASVANLAMMPMQDLLALGSEHRLNTPGVSAGNWHWRFQWEQVPADLADRLRHMMQMYGRM